MASGERKDLSLVFFWTLFFVQILQYESLTLWPVDSCPGNQSEVEAATLRLNCSDVRESINVYHCLPLSNLSDLVEFCYDGRSGLVEAGNCMVLYRETLNNYQCGHFKNGCPNAYYFPKNMYKYPACLKINTQNNCYIADPSCPNIRFFGTTTISSVTSTEKTTTMPTYTAVDNKSLYVEATSIPALSGNNNHRLLHLIPVLLGVLLPLLAVVLVILLSCRMDKRTGKDPAEEHELKENLFKTVNKDTSFEMDETSPLIADTPMNEDKHHELEGSLPLKSDEDYSLNEMQTYLEDNEFLERYQKYLEEGSVEVCPISQIIIVGEQGVGKTTLLYRLQGKSQEEIKAITSTRGVECHTEQHSFIITKNQLEMNLRGVSSLAVDPGHVNTFSEERERGNNTETKHDKVTKQDIATESDTDSKHDDQTEPNNEAKHDKQMEHDKEPKHDEQREVETESNHDKESHTDEEQKHDEQIVRDIEPKHDEQKEIDKEQKHYEQTERDKESKHDEQTEANTESNHDKTENDKEQKHYKQAEDDTDPKETECETKSFITLLEEELEERKLKLRFGNKDDVVLDVLDFAGQGEYYASHQTYIRKDAIFILLVDTSKDVNKRTEQQERKGNLSIQKTVDKKIFLCDRPGVAFHCWSPKDYFYYWLKTIQIHGGMSERIIFVGTHEDKKRDDFDFGHLLNDAITENLITEKYSKPIITNLCRYDEVTEDALSKIKNEICIHIKKCTRENQPAKWVKFASRFDMIKRKFHMGTIEDVLQMIDHFDPEMSDTEVADMLHFFHSSGKIIFFNIDRLQDIVILDIPWFINCFKHIIADRKHVEEDCSIVDVKDQKMLRIFHEKGILEICLYRKLLTQKSISEQYQNTLGEYQSKLGMMFYIQNYKINDGSSIDGWYIPSINTQEFKPIIERYGSDESSQILCIKFKDYLPYDFFGRLVVACVNSGHWHPYDYRLCKNGADMCYRDSNNDSKQIYLFTSRKIVTAQFIGKHSKKHGLEVKQEILNIVRQLVQFYARSNEYEIGFLCRKKEGYMEDSVNHFVSKRYKYCQGCHGTCDWVDTESFWKEESNTENTISTRKLVPSQIAYKVYSHFVTRVSEIAATTTILQGISSNLDWAWIDDLAFIGRELNDLHRKSDADAEKKDTALRNISKVLKKISCGLDKKTGFKDFRKEIFFLWTQTTGLFEEIQGIPVVSLKQKEKHGTEISLEAETDVPIRHHLWLKKIQSNRQYKVLRPSDEEGEKYKFQEYKDKLLMTIKNFDVQDNGHYFVLVVTETGASVCRETIQPFADPVLQNTLGKELQQKIDKSRKLLKEFKENISDVFVKTRAYTTVLSTLEKHRYCLVKGNPGDGKTTIAKQILLELEQKGMYPIEIYEIKDIESLPMFSKIAIFIDNIFGENCLQENQLHNFKVRENMIKATVSNDEGKGGNVLITTIRNDIYKECSNILKNNDFFRSSVIDISETENQINGEEFQEFVRKYKLQHLSPYMEKLDIHSFGCSIGIPQCFRLLKNNAGIDTNDVHQLFKSPLDYLQSEIEKRIQDKEPKTAVLIYILLCGGSVSTDTLGNPRKDTARKYKAINIIGMNENSNSLQKFHKSVRWFDGVYTIHDDIERTCKFSHSSVQKSIFHYLWQYNPIEVISECDPSLLVSLTALNSTLDTKGIDIEMFPFLVERIRVLITEKKTVHTFKSISLMKIWANNEFIDKFMKNRKCIEAMRESVDETEDSMLVHFSKAGNATMVGCLLYHSSEKQVYKSLNKACSYNNIDVVDLILKTNIKYDLKTCFYAVQSGNIEMLFRFTDSIDLKQTEFSNHPRWSFLKGGLLHEICFFGQNQLIKPILRRYPTVRDVQNEQGGNALHFVAFAGQKDSFQMLVNSGSDPYSRSQLGTTVLHYACQNGKLQMVKYICETYPKLLTKSFDDYEGRSSLHWAAQSGNIELYKYLLEKDVKISSTNDSYSPLNIACKEGHLKLCNYVLKTSPELHELIDKDGESALHAAAFGGNTEIFKLLIDKELDVKSTTNNGKTVLHQCCMNGKLEMCKYLVNKHPELLEISDNDGKTVLHDAAWGGNVDVFNFLIDKGLNVKSTTKNGKTVLHYCCMKGRLELCKCLVYKYPELLEIIDDDRLTVLHVAAWGGNVDIFQFLVDKGLDVKSTTKYGRTVLHYGCRNGKLQICKYLADKNPDLLNVIDHYGDTVLHDAAYGGNIDVFKLLIDKGLEVENITFESRSVLDFSCMNGKLTMSKFLLSNYPHLLNVRNVYNENKLTAAAWGGNVELFKLLIDRGLVINCSSRYGKSMLHWSCRNGKIEMSKYLVSRYPNLLGALDYDGMNVLHDAAFGGNVKLYEYLIDKGLDVNSKAYNGKTVLQWCCRKGKQAMFKYLNNKYSHFLHLKDDNDENVLHDAAWGGNVNLLEKVIEEGFDVDSKTKQGKTVLHQACKNGMLPMCKYLDQIQPELVKCIDNDGGNLLHDAAWGGQVEVFKFVLEKGLDVYNKTKKGKTILHQSCMNGEVYMCKYLINHYPDLLEHVDNEGESVLHDAAFGGNIYLLNFLIDKGLDVNRKTNKGKTVLHKCCINGKVQMCEYLVNHQPQLLTGLDNDGFNALHDTAIGGEVELFKFLLEKGLDVYSKTGTCQTALHLSCHVGKHVGSHVDKQAMFHYLIESYPDLLDVVDNEGNTVLHVACVQNQTKICSSLVENFPDLLNIENKNGEKIVVCFDNGEKQFKIASEQ